MSELKQHHGFDPAAENDTGASIARFALLGGPEVLLLGAGSPEVARYLTGEHGRDVTDLDGDVDALTSMDGRQFDVVILRNVLEHLLQPGQTLERLLSASLLRADGLLVLSVPNASHQSVVSELLVGDLRYGDSGVLDDGPVRWFTLERLTSLVERAGFIVDRVERTRRTLEETASVDRSLDLSEDLRRRMVEMNDESMTQHFIVLARPNTPLNRAQAELDAVRAERQALHTQRDGLMRDRRVLQHEVGRLAELLRSEQDAKLADAAAAAAERQVLTAKIQQLHAQILATGKRVDRLQARARKWRATARAQERELDFYRSSRALRAAERMIRLARRAG
jgi:SAM-dependent methyltransferase